jgi:hypothetical protein
MYKQNPLLQPLSHQYKVSAREGGRGIEIFVRKIEVDETN